MATKVIAWNSGSGNITLTYQGQGNGPITVQSDDNDIGTARSQTITVETIGGAVAQNLTISQAACPFPVNTTRSYSYTGSYQEVELPAGQYKLQCWGAQGGSNGTNSTYGITAKAGGKGGYSEGVITLSQKTTVRVYVGGQGSSSSGGYNGGGSTTGTSQYNSGNTLGYSKMGGGGGATDIRLSDGALLSRMIVAGGGSGGAMCYKAVTTSTTSWESVSYTVYKQDYYMSAVNPHMNPETGMFVSNLQYLSAGSVYKVKCTAGSGTWAMMFSCSSSDIESGTKTTVIQWSSSATEGTYTVPSSGYYGFSGKSGNLTVQKQKTTSSTTTSTDYQVGGVGGGTQGGGYSTTYVGKQSSAGTNGSFGAGAAMSATNYRYCSGAGGGGWYGGGSAYSDSSMTYVKYSGGGSGWVNTSASSGNRPSGYSGLQLDSGTTYAGDTSFPSTSGSTETGHSGNGYAKITRLS